MPSGSKTRCRCLRRARWPPAFWPAIRRTLSRSSGAARAMAGNLSPISFALRRGAACCARWGRTLLEEIPVWEILREYSRNFDRILAAGAGGGRAAGGICGLRHGTAGDLRTGCALGRGPGVFAQRGVRRRAGRPVRALAGCDALRIHARGVGDRGGHAAAAARQRRANWWLRCGSWDSTLRARPRPGRRWRSASCAGWLEMSGWRRRRRSGWPGWKNALPRCAGVRSGAAGDAPADCGFGRGGQF